MPDAVTLTVPARPQYVALARLAAGEAAVRAGLDHEAVEDMRLAVSEACTNALRHVHGDETLRVVFSPEDGALTVEVEHHGEVSSPLEALEDAALDDDVLGLQMIENLSDEFCREHPEGKGPVIRFVRRAGHGTSRS